MTETTNSFNILGMEGQESKEAGKGINETVNRDSILGKERQGSMDAGKGRNVIAYKQGMGKDGGNLILNG